MAQGHEMSEEKKEDYVFMVFVAIGVITATTVLWLGWKLLVKGYEWCHEMWYHEEKKELKKIEAENEEMKELNAEKEKRIEELEEQLEKLCYTNYEEEKYKERCDTNIQELMHVLENQVKIEKDNAEYWQKMLDNEIGKSQQKEARMQVLQQRIDVLTAENRNMELRLQDMNLGRHEVLVTRWGQVWHGDERCHHLRQSTGIMRYAACTSCVRGD